MSKDISDQESLYKIIQCTIEKCITDALLSVDIQSVRGQMWHLCHTSFDVPTQLQDWAMQQVNSIQNSANKEEMPKPCSLPVQEEKPLLSKDTLYHASLCCQAVSTCTPVNFKKFFNIHGHKLSEVSMSITQDQENVDHYIIAKQDNIIYMAFLSEPALSEWFHYGSFANGII